MDEYFETFGGVRDYLGGIVDEARRTGFTETIFGRRRYLPDLTSDNRQRREMAERMALNAPIQGSAADIIKIAMLNVDRALRQQGLASRMLLQVHDELVFEVADGRARGARGAGARADGRSRRPDRPPRRLGRHRQQPGTPPRTEQQGASAGVLGDRSRAVGGRLVGRSGPGAQQADREQRQQQGEVDASTTTSSPSTESADRPTTTTPTRAAHTRITARRDCGRARCRRAAAASARTVPSTAKTHSSPSRSAYWLPPTKTTASSESSQTPAEVSSPSSTITARARNRVARAAATSDMDGKASTTTNCGRNSTALTRISPPAYRPAWCSSSTLRATRMSTLERAKKASRALELWNVSCQSARVLCSVERSPGWRGWRSASQPTSTGAYAADGHAEQRRELGRPDHDERGPDHQAGDARGEVDPGERTPSPLALEDAGLGPHQGQGSGRERHQGGGRQAVQAHDPVDHGREQADEGRSPAPDAADPEDPVSICSTFPGSAAIRRAAVACRASEPTTDHEQDAHQGAKAPKSRGPSSRAAMIVKP